MKLPSSSLKATRTSSSSSTDSAFGELARAIEWYIIVLFYFDFLGLLGAGRGRLTIKKRDELLTGALRAKGEGDGGEPVDGIQTEQNIIVLFGSVSQSRR